jgi:two-component system, LytTR family, sensor kinase
MENPMGVLFRYRIWWHILFWVVWYFFYTITYSVGVLEKYQFIQNLYLLPVRMIITYSLIYWILPKFLFTRKYFLFGSLVVLHAITFGLAIWAVQVMTNEIRFLETLPFIRPLVLNYQIPATAAAIYMFKRWYLIQQYTLSLEKEKIESELNFLKSQIHPHFLFNTLNNLYALTLKKSDKAPDMVIQLSHLLEYTLYSGNRTEVELQDELKQLIGYIDLEKLRFGKRLKTNVDITEKVDGLMIAPLLLLPFLENSFKHGASQDMKTPFIELKADVVNNQLLFTVINSYRNENGKFERYKERIGLKNVKRRLELIYPKKHSLEINQKEDTFEVVLKLELNNKESKSQKK